MKAMLAQTERFLSRARVLRGGRAPARWRSELALHTSRYAKVFRATDWLKEVTDCRLSFFDQPLFGSCLAEITGTQPSRSNEPEETLSTTTHSRLSQPNFDLKALEPARASRFSDSPRAMAQLPKTDRERNKAFDLPLRAANSLLTQAAGPLLDVFARTDKSLKHISTLQRSHSASPTLELLNQLGQDDCVRRLSIRTAKRLQSWPKTITVATCTTPLPSINTQKGSGRTFLEEQWAAPLNGPQVSPGLLDHISPGTQSLQPSGRSNRPQKTAREKAGFPKTPESNVTSAASLDRSEYSTSHFEFHNQSPPHLKQISIDSDRRTSPGTPFELPRAAVHDEVFGEGLIARLEHLSSTDQAGSRSVPAIAPPALTATLPALIPAVPGVPVEPLATETTRRGAWREEVFVPEKDLNFLAAQIKRILDEEARRHGIDV